MADMHRHLARLKSDNSDERAQAARALGMAQATDALELLLELLNDPVTEVRREAVYALRRIRDERASPSMILMLNDEDDAIRRSASTWFMTLTGDQSHLVEPLCEIMLAPNIRRSTRDFAAMLLGKFGNERAVEPLHQLIADYPDMRLRATFSLLRMKDPRSVLILRELLVDDDLRVQHTAIRVLQAIATPEALDAVHWWEQKQGK